MTTNPSVTSLFFDCHLNYVCSAFWLKCTKGTNWSYVCTPLYNVSAYLRTSQNYYWIKKVFLTWFSQVLSVVPCPVQPRNALIKQLLEAKTLTEWCEPATAARVQPCHSAVLAFSPAEPLLSLGASQLLTSIQLAQTLTPYFPCSRASAQPLFVPQEAVLWPCWVVLDAIGGLVLLRQPHPFLNWLLI